VKERIKMDYGGYFLKSWKHGDYEPELSTEKSDYVIARVLSDPDATTYVYAIPESCVDDFFGWVASCWGHRQVDEELYTPAKWGTTEKSIDVYLDRIGVSAWIED
jgi:hypothetical protein